MKRWVTVDTDALKYFSTNKVHTNTTAAAAADDDDDNTV